jgi:hypothetical protein
MIAKKVQIERAEQLLETMDKLGARNTDMMALRGIYRNIIVKDVPGAHARMLKRHYNDVGAEVAISHDAWLEKDGVVTDILVMGSLYQHSEVRAAMATVSEIQTLLSAIKAALD